MIYATIAIPALIAFVFGYFVGRARAPKEVTIIHPWPDDERCESILGGLASVQCRFEDGHKGPHRARWDGRDWAFNDGDEIGPIE